MLSDENGGKVYSAAFSLAEILITLGIIGVVAVMVLPAVIQNAHEAQYKTAKDKVRMSIAEAGRLMSVTGSIADASSTEDFVKNYLSKQLKIMKFCAPADIEKCGMPSGSPTKFKNLYNADVTFMPTTWSDITSPFGVTVPAPADGSASYSPTNPTTQKFDNSYAFLTADGIAVNLFYNPYCVSSPSERPFYDSPSYSYTNIRLQMSLDTVCMSGVYDMNGLSEPNKLGRDMGFFGVFYNGIQSTSVATLPYKDGIDTSSDTWDAANTYCQGIKGYKLPSIDELSALYLGRNITGMPSSGTMYWSASGVPGGNNSSRGVLFDLGNRVWGSRSDKNAVRCVRD